jgi:hypothetical protein
MHDTPRARYTYMHDSNNIPLPLPPQNISFFITMYVHVRTWSTIESAHCFLKYFTFVDVCVEHIFIVLSVFVDVVEIFIVMLLLLLYRQVLSHLFEVYLESSEILAFTNNGIAFPAPAL